MTYKDYSDDRYNPSVEFIISKTFNENVIITLSEAKHKNQQIL